MANEIKLELPIDIGDLSEKFAQAFEKGMQMAQNSPQRHWMTEGHAISTYGWTKGLLSVGIKEGLLTPMKMAPRSGGRLYSRKQLEDFHDFIIEKSRKGKLPQSFAVSSK